MFLAFFIAEWYFKDELLGLEIEKLRQMLISHFEVSSFELLHNPADSDLSRVKPLMEQLNVQFHKGAFQRFDFFIGQRYLVF